MGVRTRGLDMKAGFKRDAADKAARAEAEAVIQRWNDQLALGRDILWSPTIRADLLAGTPWLDVFCPGCHTSRAIDLRKVDRHPLASVATLVLGLRCSWCPETAPMPRILGLHALPPVKTSDSSTFATATPPKAAIKSLPPIERRLLDREVLVGRADPCIPDNRHGPSPDVSLGFRPSFYAVLKHGSQPY
jgi:hypothetical protein